MLLIIYPMQSCIQEMYEKALAVRSELDKIFIVASNAIDGECVEGFYVEAFADPEDVRENKNNLNQFGYPYGSYILKCNTEPQECVTLSTALALGTILILEKYPIDERNSVDLTRDDILKETRTFYPECPDISEFKCNATEQSDITNALRIKYGLENNN